MSVVITKEDELNIIRILIGEMDIGADAELYDKLFEYYMDEMPYGVQKARDGDPCEWIYERLIDDFDYLIKVTELTEKDLTHA